MINVPKGLAPHEVDLYISAFKFCEKLIQEQNTDIGAAVTETTEKYSFIISDKELFMMLLISSKAMKHRKRLLAPIVSIWQTMCVR